MLKFKLIKPTYTFKLNVYDDYAIYILLKSETFLKSHSASYQSSYIVRKNSISKIMGKGVKLLSKRRLLQNAGAIDKQCLQASISLSGKRKIYRLGGFILVDSFLVRTHVGLYK